MLKFNTQKSPIRVIGFGTFDGVHRGHLSYLQQLRALGDEVFVVIARDCNVKKIKGRPPKRDEKKRLASVRRAQLADHVSLGDPDDFYRCLRDFQPDIIGLGYDQRANTDEIKRQFPGADIVRLKAFEPEIYKSSLLD